MCSIAKCRGPQYLQVGLRPVGSPVLTELRPLTKGRSKNEPHSGQEVCDESNNDCLGCADAGRTW